MKTVHKYPIEITDTQDIEMPFGAEILHHGYDPIGRLCVWAMVETLNSNAPVTLAITGTGGPLPAKECEYIGSVCRESFVWHIWRIL